jgi:predicted metal-binding membrane protein
VTIAITRERSTRASGLITLAVGLAAWLGFLLWAIDMGMGPEPGTMGLGIGGFLAMWVLMMAAMMLPAAAPLVSLYARTIQDKPTRLVAFAGGYVLAWTSTGLIAYVLASSFDRLAEDRPNAGQALAVGALAACGVYQLTPLKRWCLRHCRSPIGHLIHYAAYRGRLRDLRAGLHHGLLCIGCCWMLMVALIVVGVMNVAAMLVLTALIVLEKRWRFGEQLAKFAGAAAIALAVAVAFQPSLAPGLHHSGDPSVMDDMSDMDM